MMTSRERLLTVLNGEIPDCVPAAPDTSNMVPARLTGRPFWDIYLYEEIPHWRAYIDCVKHFNYDALVDGYFPVRFDDLNPNPNKDRKRAIVKREEDRLYVRSYREVNGKKFWSNGVTIFFKYDAPVGATLEQAGVDIEPNHFEPVYSRNPYGDLEGEAFYRMLRNELGDHGLLGVFCGTSVLIHDENEIYDYYDNPEKYEEKSHQLLEFYEKYFHRLMQMNPRPDFICTGGSGTLVYQNVEMFRKLGLPIVKRITQLCKEYGVPSHVHSCGPEAQLVKICHDETDLTVIDPLEIPPMGNCILKDLKRLYGDKLVLKGNLHTTNTMLNGSVEDVIRASKQAIDDGAAGGRFILSTGDQCGRDTPEENLFAMIETAHTYGKYNK